MKKLAILNPEKASVDDVKKYRIRRAARAIIVDENNLVGLLHVSKKNYYKLPGGGIEKVESIEEALARECLEEIGSNIDIISEIGFIIEYRKLFNQEQTSYCYLVKVKGEKKSPNFTKRELERDFRPVWLPYSEALSALSKSAATTFEGKYVVPRDIIFLKEAKKHLDKLI